MNECTYSKLRNQLNPTSTVTQFVAQFDLIHFVIVYLNPPCYFQWRSPEIPKQSRGKFLQNCKYFLRKFTKFFGVITAEAKLQPSQIF